jgi:RNA 3'-terminal phosphate cyclase (ATP)
VRATLERPGFYPAGGGRIVVEIQPAPLRPIELDERGPLVRRHARAMVASLARHIAERELRVVQRVLSWPNEELEVVELANPAGPGNILTLTLEYAHVTEVFTGFGEVGRAAEAVANDAAHQCRRYLKDSAPVGEHLTDQLLLPLAIAGGGRFTSTGMSPHAETHVHLIRHFLDVPIRTERQATGATAVCVG